MVCGCQAACVPGIRYTSFVRTLHFCVGAIFEILNLNLWKYTYGHLTSKCIAR